MKTKKKAVPQNATRSAVGAGKDGARKTTKPRAFNTTCVPRRQAERIASEIVDNALARSSKHKEPTPANAAVAIARAWLTKAGFHEDPEGESPERIAIGFSDVDADGDRYVNVRIYIPALDVDHVVNSTHPDGIAVEGAARSIDVPGTSPTTMRTPSKESHANRRSKP